MGTPVDIFHSIEIAAPARLAYDTWMRVEALSDHLHHVEGVKRTSDDQASWYVNVGGVRREFDTVILDSAEDRYLAWTSTHGPVHHGTITLHSLDPHTTRVDFWMRYEPEGVLETLARWFGVVERAVERDLRRTAVLIEDAALQDELRRPLPQAA